MASNTSATSTVTTSRSSYEALEEAKKVDDGPVIVHALTTKGKGFPNPEKNYYAYHATGPFDPKTGLAIQIEQGRHRRQYTAVFGETMCELMADG